MSDETDHTGAAGVEFKQLDTGLANEHTGAEGVGPKLLGTEFANEHAGAAGLEFEHLGSELASGQGPGDGATHTDVVVVEGSTVYTPGSSHPFRAGDTVSLAKDDALLLTKGGHVATRQTPQAPIGHRPTVIDGAEQPRKRGDAPDQTGVTAHGLHNVALPGDPDPNPAPVVVERPDEHHT